MAKRIKIYKNTPKKKSPFSQILLVSIGVWWGSCSLLWKLISQEKESSIYLAFPLQTVIHSKQIVDEENCLIEELQLINAEVMMITICSLKEVMQHWFSNFSMRQNHLKSLLKQIAAPSPDFLIY